VGKVSTLIQTARAFGVRDGMLRLDYELRRGSGLLSREMRSVQGWDAWPLSRTAPGQTGAKLLSARREGSHKFLFADVRDLAARIRNVLGHDKESSLLAHAENILSGDLPFFGRLSFDCGVPPQWFRNPATGQCVSPKQRWMQMRFSSRVYGDLKFILEPSRFLFVYPLVRAYALTGDERLPRAFWSAVEDWTHHNPPMSGPLWICGQECSLRILAWTFALRGFIHSSSTTADRTALLASMIAAHAWRTAQTLGYARSQRSNHLISEAVGLWTAGTLFPELRDAQSWREVGAELLHEAVLDQIAPHGVSQQHSFNYQRMILHLLLWALRLADVYATPLHPEIRQRTEAAYDFMRSWVDPVGGCAPNYGSDDGSLIFPLAQAEYRDFRPLLQLGAAVLHRGAMPSGTWDEAAIWFGVTPEPARQAKDLPPPSVETGYFRLGDKHSWAMIRAGRYTRRPFQADQLHVDLWCGGLNIARDPGTYLYNGASPWNNAFARTCVHNTVTVDGHDQMRRASRFLWLDWAQAIGGLQTRSDEQYTVRFEGEHDGYRHLGITHHRSVYWVRDAGWMILDKVQGEEVHDARLHWLLADFQYELSESPFEVTLMCGKQRVRFIVVATAPASSAIIRAGKQIDAQSQRQLPNLTARDIQLLGWEAPTYGELRPALSVIYQTRSPLPVRFATVVLTDERSELKTQNGRLIIVREGEEIHNVAFPAQFEIANESEVPPVMSHT
jgi:hypothetical protein